MNGFDFSQFTELITQVEKLGADMDQVTEHVLDAGSEPAKLAFQNNVPVDTTTPTDKRQHEHARDHVGVSKTKKSKYGNKYRVIGATGGNSANRISMKRTRNYRGNVQKYTDTNADPFAYLYIVENGSSTSSAHPFIEKAYREAQVKAGEPMAQALVQEIENHLR
jgi:HK97 gp10 family phage protein